MDVWKYNFSADFCIRLAALSKYLMQDDFERYTGRLSAGDLMSNKLQSAQGKRGRKQQTRKTRDNNSTAHLTSDRPMREYQPVPGAQGITLNGRNSSPREPQAKSGISSLTASGPKSKRKRAKLAAKSVCSEETGRQNDEEVMSGVSNRSVFSDDCMIFLTLR